MFRMLCFSPFLYNPKRKKKSLITIPLRHIHRFFFFFTKIALIYRYTYFFLNAVTKTSVYKFAYLSSCLQNKGKCAKHFRKLCIKMG